MLKDLMFEEPIIPNRADLERGDAIDLVLIHAIACSTLLFPGLVSQDVIDAMDEYTHDIVEKLGEDLVPMIASAIRLLAIPPETRSDYERQADDLGLEEDWQKWQTHVT